MRTRRIRVLLAVTAGAAAAVSTVALSPLATAAPDTSGAAAPGSSVRTTVNAKSRAQLDAYWTPERLRAAKPVPVPAGTGTAARALPAAEPTGKRVFAHGTEPADANADAGARQQGKAGAGANAVDTKASVWNTVGRLYFTIPGKGDFICSGNVVTSNNRSVLATARHCGFGEGGTNFRFAPAYDKGSAPYGWWGWRSAHWVTGEGQQNDVAFLTLDAPGGRRVQDVVGSTGIGFNWDINNYAHILGLPGDKDYAVWCEGRPYAGPGGQALMNNCNGLSGGASGGAFLVNYQGDGSAVQTGAYSGSYGAAAAAGYFRDAARSAWDGAQNA